jgi:predicted MPP superfamily phosphohydrolase
VRAAPAFVAGALSAAALGALLHAALVEPRRIEVTRHTVGLALDEPLTIAHLTDLHTRGLGMRERRMLTLLEREHPDVIVVTGDIVADRGTLAEALPVLARLRARLGVWAVRGNWEHWRSAGNEAAALGSVGVGLLDNQARALQPGIWLAGFDDALAGRPDPDAALHGIPDGAVVIGLFHSPAFFDRVAGRIPLAFAGHTHGGQVRLPGLPPFWLPRAVGRYVAGWFERSGSRLYVSRGIGTTILPLRFDCRPELAIVTLVVPGQARRRTVTPNRNSPDDIHLLTRAQMRASRAPTTCDPRRTGVMVAAP